MAAAAGPESNHQAPPKCFLTTHWSVVLAAKQEGSVEAQVALNRLCTTYWWPLYAFVRQRGHNHHDAQDLIQGFFNRQLARNFLSVVDRSKGRFRSYLLATMVNFLANEWRDAKAQKRGGQYTFVSMDGESAEKHYLQIASTTKTPEQIYDYQWATKLFAQALDRLWETFVTEGKEAQFHAIKIFLTGEKQAATYAELAARLGTTEAALKMAVNRMRQRYSEFLRAEIANTVDRPEEIDDELRALIAALST